MFMGPLAVRQEYARNFAAASEKFGKTAAAIINLSEPEMRDIFQKHHIPVFDAATDACFKMLRGYIDHGRFLKTRSLRRRQTLRSSEPRAAVAAILKAHPGVSMLPHAGDGRVAETLRLSMCGVSLCFELRRGSGTRPGNSAFR